MMPERETVLILGAAGRFGRHAVDAFRAGGWRVRALTRPGREGPSGVEAVHGDAADAEALTAAAEGADLIVNAVNPPYPAWSDAVPKLTEAVVAAARASGATVLLPGNVYNYGSTPPEVMSEPPPEDADTRKGRIRCRMERAYREGGVPTIVLRAGDFIDDRDSGNWFESHLASRVPRGRFVYPGPLDRVHAWAWLPDLARAAELLARRRSELPRFATIGFPGFALTGAELHSAVERPRGVRFVCGRCRGRSFGWPRRSRRCSARCWRCAISGNVRTASTAPRSMPCCRSSRARRPRRRSARA